MTELEKRMKNKQLNFFVAQHSQSQQHVKSVERYGEFINKHTERIEFVTRS